MGRTVERSKHFSNTGKKRETVYIYSDDKDLFVDGNTSKPNGKYLFFDALGITMIKMSYEEIYDKYELKIKSNFS